MGDSKGKSQRKSRNAFHAGLLYMILFTSGRLNEYLASVDALAVDMFFRLATKYSDRQGVTEQLKSKNQFLWIQKMNNILARVREVVENDIIYS